MPDAPCPVAKEAPSHQRVARLRTNIAANFAAQAWTGILQLLLVPFYLHYLGIEAYGLIGVYLMLLASVQVFDLGFSQTLNRELARRSAGPVPPTDALDLLRTIEITYWSIVAIVCVCLLVAVPTVSRNLINPSLLEPEVLHRALMLMVLVIAINWPAGLYYNGLLGLQRQLEANLLRMVVGTTTSVGSLVVLAFVSPTIVAFFAWQLASALFGLIATAVLLRRILPSDTRRPRFRRDLLKTGWRFAAGAGTLSISGLVLTQFDKWILIKVLPLKEFGYYTLANTVANVLHYAIAPMFAAVFPRLSALLATGAERAVLRVYHVASQAVTTVIVPIAAFLALFAHEVLTLWTGNENLATLVAPLAAIMVVGTALNGLMHMPYALQLARGRTRLFLIINLAAIAILIPVVVWAAPRFGAIVGALAWLTLNASYLLLAAPIAHREMSAKDRFAWLANDIARPGAAALVVLLIARMAIDSTLGWQSMFFSLAAALAAAVLVAASNATALRSALRSGRAIP